MKKKRLLSLLLTGALCLSLSAPALAAGLENFQKTNTYTAGQFTDIPAGEWYAANVQAAYELGLMEGSSATTFNPSGNLTIAEALVLACRLHSTYVGDGATFAGSGGAWYQPYVDYAVENGIITANAYSSYIATATRAQFASILAAALPAEALTAINSVTALPDVAADAAYAPAVLSLYNAGVLTGSDSAGSFKPDTTIQRSEVATIVTRMADPSLRRTFTLTPAEGTGTQPSASGKKFDSTTITADDLQGTWYATVERTGEECEWIFEGNRFTYTTHRSRASTGDDYTYITGTFTVSSEPLNGDANIAQISLDMNVEDGYFTEGDSFLQNTKVPFTSSREYNADLRMPQDCFVYYDGTTFYRADTAEVYTLYQSAFQSMGMVSTEPDPAVYDFLANYIQTEGHEATSIRYAGQYECYLDLYQTLNSNKNWMYSVYYDPAADRITLAGSFFSAWGEEYDFTFHTDCTLVLTPDMTPPYTVTYTSSNMVTNLFGDLMLEPGGTSATAYLDPDNFTDHTESVTFETYEGYSDSDSLMNDQKNCAVNLGIMLIALDRDILSPNGHSLYELGFDELSMY